ncbi:MAG TPA: hypothetical protein DCM05_10860 [Elusimicrobia bacterium]|nr:hypothetical protein [Elusimicrobiota bacterium]
MDPKATQEFDIPKIEGQTLRAQEEKEKKGAGFLGMLLSKLGLNGGALGGAALGEAGALGGLMATNAGVIGLILVGTTIAAGTGMYWTFSGSKGGASPNVSMSSMLPKSDAQSSDALAAAGQRPGGGAEGASSSLDYVAQANGAAGQGAGEGAGADAGSAEGAGAAEAGADGQTQDAAASSGGGSASASPGALARAPLHRPAFHRSQGLGASGSSGASTSARSVSGGGSAQAALGGGNHSVRGNPSLKASRNMASSKFGRRAVQQAGQARKLAQGNLKSGQVSSAGSGLTYDGGRGAVGTAGVPAGKATEGVGLGGTGLANTPSATTMKDLKEIQPPVPDVEEKKNVTPYQNLIYAAIGALAVGFIALLLAGQFVKQAQAGNVGMWMWAKLLAGIATAAGIAAAAIGGILWAKYEQMGQGMMFLMSGGLLAFQSGKVLMDAFAAEKAQKELATKVGAADAAMRASLDVPKGAPAPKVDFSMPAAQPGPAPVVDVPAPVSTTVVPPSV